MLFVKTGRIDGPRKLGKFRPGTGFEPDAEPHEDDRRRALTLS